MGSSGRSRSNQRRLERVATLASNNSACTLMQFGRDSEALDELAEALPALLRLRNPWTNYYLISSFSEVYARGGDARRAVMPHGTSNAIAVSVGDATQPTPEEAQEWDLLAAEIRKTSAEQWMPNTAPAEQPASKMPSTTSSKPWLTNSGRRTAQLE